MNQPAIGSYYDTDGAKHELVVVESADGGWRVLDLDLDTPTEHVVEMLAGGEDGRPQAEAIARDYLSTVTWAAVSAGPALGDRISEQGEPDARNHRRPRPGPHTRQARGVALPRAAR